MHRGEERGALDELVARQREQATLRSAGAAVVRPTDALEERGDAARRADLAHELHRADVDPELERCGGDECTQVTGAQPGLDPVATVFRQAAVVRGDRAVAQPLTELVGEPFREPAGVHEHERGAVLTDELGDAVEHVAHLLGRGDGFELALGQFQREIEVALVTGVDDLGDGARADEQPRHRLDRALGRGESDALRRLLADRLEPFEREREVRAALVACDRVDLVDDDGLDGAEELASPRARDEQVERFGRGDHEARRSAQHRGAFGAGGVAGAHRDAQLGRVEPQLLGDRGDLGERALEVLGDVDRERLQRRDVDDPRGACDLVALLVGAVEAVDADEEAAEGLARSGGRGDQRVVAGRDVRPALGLGRGGPLGEAPPEPLRDGRVEPGQGGVRVTADPRPQRELHRRGSHRPLFNLMGTTSIPFRTNRRRL